MSALRILVFNWHESIIHTLCELEHTFDVVGTVVLEKLRPDSISTWKFASRPLPKNTHLIIDAESLQKNLRDGVYDLALCFHELDLCYLESESLPKLFCPLISLKRYLGQDYDNPELCQQVQERIAKRTNNVSVVYLSSTLSQRDVGGYGIPGEVLSEMPCINPEDYKGYTGEKAEALRVGNFLSRRPYMNYEFQEEVLSGLSHRIVGVNPGIPRAIAAKSWRELRKNYRECRVFFSTVFGDFLEAPMPLSQLEAMMTGMPVVTTPHPFSIVEDGVNGFVSGDIPTLQKRLKQLLEDMDLACEMGAKARQTVLERYPFDAYLKSWERVLRRSAEGEIFPASSESLSDSSSVGSGKQKVDFSSSEARMPTLELPSVENFGGASFKSPSGSKLPIVSKFVKLEKKPEEKKETISPEKPFLAVRKTQSFKKEQSTVELTVADEETPEEDVITVTDIHKLLPPNIFKPGGVDVNSFPTTVVLDSSQDNQNTVLVGKENPLDPSKTSTDRRQDVDPQEEVDTTPVEVKEDSYEDRPTIEISAELIDAMEAPVAPIQEEKALPKTETDIQPLTRIPTMEYERLESFDPGSEITRQFKPLHESNLDHALRLLFASRTFCPASSFLDTTFNHVLKMLVEQGFVCDALCLGTSQVTVQSSQVMVYYSASLEGWRESIRERDPDLILTQLEMAPMVNTLCRELDKPYALLISDYQHFCPTPAAMFACNRACSQCRFYQPHSDMMKAYARTVTEATEVICTSEHLASLVYQFYNRDTKVWPLPVQTPEVVQLPFKASSNRYISMSASANYSGLKLFSEIARRLPEREFVVADMNPEDDGPDGMKDLPNMKFWSKMDPVRLIFSSQLFLVPTEWPESDGHLALQAMAYGVPVVVGGLGALPEIVGQAGLIVQNAMEPNAWIEQICSLLNNPALYTHFVQEGHNWVHQFSLDRQVPKLKAILEASVGVDKMQ